MNAEACAAETALRTPGGTDITPGLPHPITDDASDSPPGRLLRLLGIRSDEAERVRDLMGACFLLGLALVLFYGSGNAIFLTRFDISMLPWVYIANAVAVIVVGIGYSALSARVPASHAIARLAAAITASVTLLWGWASVSDGSVVAFLMAMWFRLLFIFGALGLWEIASTVFDIRQAKRLFPAVALGMMLAFVVGGAATPLLGALVGTVNLVGIAALFFALYTLDLRRLLHRHQVGTRNDAESVPPAGPREILADRFSRRMVWMKTVTITMMYVTEYVFYEMTTSTFHSAASVAGFLGAFTGLLTIVMVLVTGLVSGRYISRFGIRTSTLTLPAGMLVVSVVTGVYGTVVGVNNGFFVLVCLALATNHVLGNAVNEPSGAVLFQPMPQAKRMRVRLAVHGWLGSVALFVAGLMLVGLNALHLPSIAPMMFLVALFAAAGIGVAIFQYRDYLAALHSATTLAFAGNDVASALDLVDPSFLTDILRSGDPSSSLATAAMVRAFETGPLHALLGDLVADSDPAVVELGLRGIANAGDPRLADAVSRTAGRADLRTTTRAAALSILIELDPARGAAATVETLGGSASNAALAAALHVPALRPEAYERLGVLATSADPLNRIAACLALAGSSEWRRDHGVHVDRLSGGRLHFEDPAGRCTEQLILALLRDADGAVVKAALGASRHRVTPAIAQELIRCAAQSTLQSSAFRALATTASMPEGLVSAALADLPAEAAAELIGQVLGPKLAVHEVRTYCLHDGTGSILRRAGYDALAAHPAPRSVRACLTADLAMLNDIVRAHRDVGISEEAVRDALRDEYRLVRRSVFGALGVEYDRRRVRDIEALANYGSEDERANALEALEVLLAADHRRAIIAVLEPVNIAEATVVDGVPTVAVCEAMRRLVDDSRLTPWTRRLVAHRLMSAAPSVGGSVDPTIARVLALRRVDIFSSLSYETLVELADLTTTRTVRADVTIVDAGGFGDELFAIVQGTVQVHTAGGHVRRLDAGTVFGELAILDPAPRSATVTALTDVELLVVARPTVLALGERRPGLFAEISRVLAKRLRDAPEFPV